MKIIRKTHLGISLSVASIFISYYMVNRYVIQSMDIALQRNAKNQQAKIKPQPVTPQRNNKQLALINGKNQLQNLQPDAVDYKKQQAWYSWYKNQEPSSCDNWQSDRHMVECVNHKIRAKREFEKIWLSQLNTSKIIR